MRGTSGQTSEAVESNGTPTQVDPIGLASAIARGSIREQDLITVLTEMCHQLLVERRKESENKSAETSPSPSVPSQPTAPQRSSSPDGGR